MKPVLLTQPLPRGERLLKPEGGGVSCRAQKVCITNAHYVHLSDLISLRQMVETRINARGLYVAWNSEEEEWMMMGIGHCALQICTTWRNIQNQISAQLVKAPFVTITKPSLDLRAFI